MGVKLCKWVVLGLALVLWGTAELCLTALQVDRRSEFLRAYFVRFGDEDVKRFAKVQDLARERAHLYESMVNQRFLDQGMVVNRHEDGRMLDQCDSLLFSSLRYVALRKLGLEDEASHAWTAIRASHKGGKWWRHPSCSKSTSRDMIVGLLAALTQKPPGYLEYLQSLIAYVGANDGFFGDGPLYVSYLSPGLAEILRHFARLERIPDEQLPRVVRYGFSTMELDTFGSRVGFESHLIALVTWIELELRNMERAAEPSGHALDQEDMRSLPLKLDRLTQSFMGIKLADQRLAWIAQRLVNTDHRNMFFRWLRLKTAGALSPKAQLVMLDELLAMPQFPVDRLPDLCDRRADYLWQRSSREYEGAKIRRGCNKLYSGVDFLWMTALLIADPPSHLYRPLSH